MAQGNSDGPSRREALAAATAGLLTLLPGAAGAFDNRSAPKGKYPPTPGTPKEGVGAGLPKDGGTLRFCDSKPNCFSPFGDKEDDPDHYYAPWKTTKSKEDAMADLRKAVEAYPPGQQNIDGGGWMVAKSQPGYLYVVFESAKRGYKDDLEFAMVKDGEVQVRSSSRLGYLDDGVNMKRINWFVDYLEKDKAWTVEKITKAAYPRYFDENF